MQKFKQFKTSSIVSSRCFVRIIFVVCAYINFNNCSVQAQNFSFAKTIGGIGEDRGYSIALDSVSGAVYTTGNFYNTVDFDPGVGVYNLTVLNGFDDFISKLDASGNFIWAKAFGGSSMIRSSIALDYSSGDFYIIGDFYDTVDFDPGSGIFNLISASPGVQDIFIAKLDSSGNFIWAKAIGGTGFDEPNSIYIDQLSGNIYTTGYFEDTVDFDPNLGVFNLTAGSNRAIFISKLDPSGNFVWAKTLNGTDLTTGNSLTVDQTFGNVYITGIFYGMVDFDPGLGTYNLTAAGVGNPYTFVLKLDSSGNFIWARAFGGIGTCISSCITLHQGGGDIYFTGFFADTVDFDPGLGIYNLSSLGQADNFISKLDSSGDFVWTKSMGGTMSAVGRSITIDLASGHVFSTGEFQSTVDFDPGAGTFNLTSSGSLDREIFISILDASGNFIQAFSMGGTGDDYGQCIALDPAGNNIYTAGFFYDTADFDPGPGTSYLTSHGFADIFISKLSYPVNLVKDIAHDQSIDVYPNPASIQLFLQFSNSNFSTMELFNSFGQCVLIKQLQVIQNCCSEVLDVQSLPAGMYIIKLTGDRILTRRVIIE